MEISYLFCGFLISLVLLFHNVICMSLLMFEYQINSINQSIPIYALGIVISLSGLDIGNNGPHSRKRIKSVVFFIVPINVKNHT